MPSSPPGSGCPDPTREEPQRPDEGRKLATGGPVLPGRQYLIDPERRQPCGYIWRNPRDGSETAIAPDEVVTVYVGEGEWIPPLPRPARDLTADQFGRLFPYRCPLCDQPLMFEIGVKAHLSVDHSWRERFKRWADEHPVKLWLALWAVLVPVVAVIVVMFP